MSSPNVIREFCSADSDWSLRPETEAGIFVPEVPMSVLTPSEFVVNAYLRDNGNRVKPEDRNVIEWLIGQALIERSTDITLSQVKKPEIYVIDQYLGINHEISDTLIERLIETASKEEVKQ